MENRSEGRLELSRQAGHPFAAFPFFSWLEAVQIAEISRRVEMQPLEARKFILEKRGLPCREEVLRPHGLRGRRGRRWALPDAGDFFGEISLIVGLPRTATVRGRNPGPLLALGAHIIHRSMDFLPDLSEPTQGMARVRLGGSNGGRGSGE